MGLEEWIAAGIRPTITRLTDRIADLERALSDEKQCATLNAECHTREIRALQDMVEAEAEARREAEGECERLVNEVQDHAMQVLKLRERLAETYALLDSSDSRRQQAEAEVVRLSEPRHEVIAPLAFGGDNCLCRERPKGGCDLLMCPHRPGGNLTAPPPVPSSSKT